MKGKVEMLREKERERKEREREKEWIKNKFKLFV